MSNKVRPWSSWRYVPAVAPRARTTTAAVQNTGVEHLYTLRPSVDSLLRSAVGRTLTKTDLPLGKCAVGKVRDVYTVADKLVIITSDRQSAFDRLLAAIPYKGQVLNQTSAWWMAKTRHIIPNALLGCPDPNVSVMQRCEVLPCEMVVRGYLTGSTETSLWTHYKDGSRDYCGNQLPEGLRKNDRLQENIITPTTKAADRDVPISPHDIVASGAMTADEWDQVSRAALELFTFGQQEAARHGLILVDTKYEFGKASDGTIMLIDEIHTPDSSRYWIAKTYEERHAKGEEPQSVDKEFLRLWFKQHCDPYADKVLPEAPVDLVLELSRRYITLFEMITGERFEPAAAGDDCNARILRNVQNFLDAQ